MHHPDQLQTRRPPERCTSRCTTHIALRPAHLVCRRTASTKSQVTPIQSQFAVPLQVQGDFPFGRRTHCRFLKIHSHEPSCRPRGPWQAWLSGRASPGHPLEDSLITLRFNQIAVRESCKEPHHGHLHRRSCILLHVLLEAGAHPQGRGKIDRPCQCYVLREKSS